MFVQARFKFFAVLLLALTFLLLASMGFTIDKYIAAWYLHARQD